MHDIWRPSEPVDTNAFPLVMSDLPKDSRILKFGKWLLNLGLGSLAERLYWSFSNRGGRRRATTQYWKDRVNTSGLRWQKDETVSGMASESSDGFKRTIDLRHIALYPDRETLALQVKVFRLMGYAYNELQIVEYKCLKGIERQVQPK